MPRADVLSPAAETIELLQREARLIEITAPFLGALSRAAGAAAPCRDARGQ
jgi:hypothetical protein